MAIVVGICLLGVLCGVGYLSLGTEAATAHALEEGLLEQKREKRSEDKSQIEGGETELRRRENNVPLNSI